MDYKTAIYKDCKTWEDFLEYLKQIKQWRQENSCGFVTELFFRGVKDSKWEMKTSLELTSEKKDYLIEDYYKKILRASQEKKICINEKWDLPPLSYYSDQMNKAHGCNFRECLFLQKEYPDIQKSFLFLRHHGFPSPLLDWTMCPRVAAHFSFPNDLGQIDKVSIFIFLESIGDVIDGEPGIHTLGPNVSAHPRHFKQKSSYTFCVKEGPPKPGCLNEEPIQKIFGSDEAAFRNRPVTQQYLWKCNIPSTESKKVHKLLDSYNITESTLFRQGSFFMANDKEKSYFLRE